MVDTQDMVCEILIRLPVRSLLRFKCVCKSWLSIITSPNFISQHLQRNSSNILYVLVTGFKNPNRSMIRILSYDTLEAADARTFTPTYPHHQLAAHPHNNHFDLTNCWIKGCCNGLLLVYFQNNYFLWNLATRQTKLLPPCLSRTKPPSEIHAGDEAVGFGFDAETNDYKVVILHISHSLSNDDWFTVDVYSLKSDCWRTIATLSHPEIAVRIVPFCHEVYDADGVYTNNGMYSWLLSKAYKKLDGNVFIIDRGRPFWYEMISFDLSKQVFIMTTLPDAISKYCWGNLNMPLVFNHSSVAVVNCVNVYKSKFDVWVLGEYGVEASWSKVFSTGTLPNKICGILGFWKDTDKVLVESLEQKLFLYDLQTMRFDHHGHSGFSNKMLYYYETLVPLNF